jgi:hypothetical protein
MPRRPSPRLAWLGVLALSSGFLNSCGYVGDPLPPSLKIPLAVGDLSAAQLGDKIILRFTLPRSTTDGIQIEKFDLVEAQIGPDVTPFSVDKWSAGATQTPIDVSVEDQTSSIVKEIDATPWAGKQIVIGVRASVRKDRWSPFSNVVRLNVVEPLEPPKISVEASSKGYVIAWTAQRPGLKFRILRRIPGVQKEPVEVGTADASPFTDRSSQFNTPYEYTVVALEGTGPNPSESASSNIAAINKPDTFPPEVPGSITALAGAGAVEVTWERSQETDLKGYLLYRSVGDGPFEKVADLLTAPAYSDHDVQPGKHYRYSVAAIDLTGNISERSSVTEIDFQ